MKASSGRIGQYKVLSTEDKLSRHLLETKLLTEESLLIFLERYRAIMIKPVFGPGEINIFYENNQFIIQTNFTVKTLSDQGEIYPYLLQYELKQKFYIVQAKKLRSHFSNNPFQYFVTVHRGGVSEEWKVVSYTEKYRSLLKRILYKYFLRKIENISILAAQTLGGHFQDCCTMVIEIIYDLKGGIWIQDTVLHFHKSKLSQYHSLASKNALINHVPETNLLTNITFNDFIKKFNTIIIKPCIGKEGLGIVQITCNQNFTFEIQAGKMKITKPTLEETYHYIKEKYLSKKYYLVQQRLPLAAINDCPMDVRVIAQKYDLTWSITGKLVKVAGKGFIITNVAQKLLTLEDALKASNISPPMNITEIESQIDGICMDAAKQLEENYSDSKIFGFDIGITDQGDIWIIEANFNPNLSMFSKMEDQTMYADILNAKKGKRLLPPDTVHPHEN